MLIGQKKNGFETSMKDVVVYDDDDDYGNVVGIEMSHAHDAEKLVGTARSPSSTETKQ
jgi:hypothetical protein